MPSSTLAPSDRPPKRNYRQEGLDRLADIFPNDERLGVPPGRPEVVKTLETSCLNLYAALCNKARSQGQLDMLWTKEFLPTLIEIKTWYTKALHIKAMAKLDGIVTSSVEKPVSADHFLRSSHGPYRQPSKRRRITMALNSPSPTPEQGRRRQTSLVDNPEDDGFDDQGSNHTKDEDYDEDEMVEDVHESIEVNITSPQRKRLFNDSSPHAQPDTIETIQSHIAKAPAISSDRDPNRLLHRALTPLRLRIPQTISPSLGRSDHFDESDGEQPNYPDEEEEVAHILANIDTNEHERTTKAAILGNQASQHTSQPLTSRTTEMQSNNATIPLPPAGKDTRSAISVENTADHEDEIETDCKRALESLQNGAWINDAAMSACLSIFCSRTRKILDCALAEPEYWHNNRNSRLCKIEDEVDTLILPINVQNKHWAMCIIELRGLVRYFDSFYANDNAVVYQIKRDIQDGLLTYLVRQVPRLAKVSFTFDNTQSLSQTNYTDCGVFTFANCLSSLYNHKMNMQATGRLWRGVMRLLVIATCRAQNCPAHPDTRPDQFDPLGALTTDTAIFCEGREHLLSQLDELGLIVALLRENYAVAKDDFAVAETRREKTLDFLRAYNTQSADFEPGFSKDFEGLAATWQARFDGSHKCQSRSKAKLQSMADIIHQLEVYGDHVLKHGAAVLEQQLEKLSQQQLEVGKACGEWIGYAKRGPAWRPSTN